MKKRIGLITSKSLAKTATTFVEVANAKELVKELTNLGAKRAALYWRDRIGDGHLEGKPFPVDEIEDSHFQWVIGATAPTIRAVYYDAKS
jgi:hypothetical protein